MPRAKFYSDHFTATLMTAELYFYQIRIHDDVIKWKYFPYLRPFVRGIYWSPVDSSYKGHWRRASMSSLMHAWNKGCANSPDVGDLRRHSAHCGVTVMYDGTFSRELGSGSSSALQGFTIDKDVIAWWRHQMETFSALLAICARNSPVAGEFPTQRPVTRSFDVFLWYASE